MIYIAEYEGYENNEHKLEITGKTVSREEYDDFMANFKFYGQYHQFKEIHEICLESNLDLMNFLSVKNLNNILRTRNVNHEKILQTGNKLLLNYCTVIKIMVEKIESYLKHNKADEIDEFKTFCSNFYDNTFAYRFFMRLRNYIIHNGMPFTKITSAIYKDCNLYIDRNNLLKWSGWSTVKNDLEKMTENDIAVQPFLQEIGASIYAIYLQSLYYLAPGVIKSLQNIDKFLAMYNVKRFDFIEFESDEDFKNGKYEYHIVPWGSLIQCIVELNKHPNININTKKD